jgi:hypothetical protein
MPNQADVSLAPAPAPVDQQAGGAGGARGRAATRAVGERTLPWPQTQRLPIRDQIGAPDLGVELRTLGPQPPGDAPTGARGEHPVWKTARFNLAPCIDPARRVVMPWTGTHGSYIREVGGSSPSLPTSSAETPTWGIRGESGPIRAPHVGNSTTLWGTAPSPRPRPGRCQGSSGGEPASTFPRARRTVRSRRRGRESSRAVRGCNEAVAVELQRVAHDPPGSPRRRRPPAPPAPSHQASRLPRARSVH